MRLVNALAPFAWSWRVLYSSDHGKHTHKLCVASDILLNTGLKNTVVDKYYELMEVHEIVLGTDAMKYVW